jgi:hypothetical protein
VDAARRPRNMEKSNQKKVEYMMNEMNKGLWIDTRLSDEEMDFLWACISEENKADHRHELAGNVSKSELLEDKDNWFYESVLKKHTEKMFYDDWYNYRKYHIVRDESPPKFKLNPIWVNYQKQHEFNPLHRHSGLYSFVIFMRIPTHWEEQHALPVSATSNLPMASDFAFVRSGKNENEMCVSISFSLSSEDEGRMLFFPSWLKHMVYPFYECEEDRVTISGNISLFSEEQEEQSEIPINEHEEKEKSLKLLEEHAEMMKEQLKTMKKESEKEE